MDAQEFLQVCKRCGYANEKAAKKYIEASGKTEFTDTDIMELYHTSMHWTECKDVKGLRYVMGANGKTTAMSNGIAGNSGERQDWC